MTAHPAAGTIWSSALAQGLRTYMAKLTLSVDSQVVSRAKQYAKLRGVSVSEMVEAYLAAVAEPPSSTVGAAPILRSVRGILKNGDIAGYREHLTAKHR